MEAFGQWLPPQKSNPAASVDQLQVTVNSPHKPPLHS